LSKTLNINIILTLLKRFVMQEEMTFL